MSLFSLLLSFWLYQNIVVYGQDESLVEGSNKFGFELVNTLAGDNRGKENIFISPYSIESCFSIAFMGADESTEQQIADVLHYVNYETIYDNFNYYTNDFESRYNGDEIESIFDENAFNPTILISNRVFVDDTLILKEDYLDKIDDSIEYVDLDNITTSVDIINDFIEESTNDLIQDAVETIDDDTKLIAVNTVYINGSWLQNFEVSMTSENVFYEDASRTTILQSTTHFMHKQDYYNYYDDDDFQYVQLFLYGNNDNNADQLSVIIALPKTDQVNLNDLTYEKYNAAIENFERIYLALVVPKISILSDTSNLVQALKSLGMEIPFTEFANFSKMTNERVQITDIIHKTILNCDEHGVEAAAATILNIGITSLPEDRILFRADHPFHLIINDNHNNIILFMGDIVKPGLPQNSIATYDENQDADLWLSFSNNATETSFPPTLSSTTTSTTTTKFPSKDKKSFLQKVKKWFKNLPKTIKSWF